MFHKSDKMIYTMTVIYGAGRTFLCLQGPRASFI